MKKLLNTLYLTQDNFYLTRERDNIVYQARGSCCSSFPLSDHLWHRLFFIP